MEQLPNKDSNMPVVDKAISRGVVTSNRGGLKLSHGTTAKQIVSVVDHSGSLSISENQSKSSS